MVEEKLTIKKSRIFGLDFLRFVAVMLVGNLEQDR